MRKAVLVPIGQGRSVHCKGLRNHCEIALGSRISGLGLRLRRLGLAKFLGAGRDLVFKCVSSINSALGRSEVSFAREVFNCSSEVILLGKCPTAPPRLFRSVIVQLLL